MDINNMNETQVKQELKKLIRSSYRKMETLRKRGYEDYQWNKDYRGFMQKKFGVKSSELGVVVCINSQLITHNS